MKEFFQDRKEDLMHIKVEAKNIFGKVKGVFTKAAGAKPLPYAEEEEEAKLEVVVKEKPKPEKKIGTGFKLFGNRVKMGISKIFQGKKGGDAGNH